MNIFTSYFELYKRAFSVWPLEFALVFYGLFTFLIMIYYYVVWLFPKMTYRKMSKWGRRGFLPYLGLCFSAVPTFVGIPLSVLLIYIDIWEVKKSVIPTIIDYAQKGVLCPHKTYNKQIKAWKLVPSDEKERLIRENTEGVENDVTLKQRVLLMGIPFIIAKLYYLAYGIIF